MASPTVNEAVRVVQIAIDLDNRHQYAEAIKSYEQALGIFARARDQLANDDPVAAVTIAQKMEEYAARAKVLRDATSQNPFAKPVGAPLGLTMAAPIPGVAGSSAPPGAAVPVYIPPPQVGVPPPAGIPPYVSMPAPQQQPVHFQPPPAVHSAPLHSLPVMVPPPVAAHPADPNANKIVRTKEQEFMGHKNKIKFVVALPRYAERLRPGEVVNLDIVVDNPTGCVVSSVKINLMSTTTVIKADGAVKRDNQKVKGDEYFQGGRFPMKEEKYEGTIEFAIPSDVQPTIAPTGSTISSFMVSYDLVVKAAVKWHDDVEIVFPIVITPRI